jgi:hypothetical protein
MKGKHATTRLSIGSFMKCSSARESSLLCLGETRMRLSTRWLAISLSFAVSRGSSEAQGKGTAVKQQSLRFFYALEVIALKLPEFAKSGAFFEHQRLILNHLGVVHRSHNPKVPRPVCSLNVYPSLLGGGCGIRTRYGRPFPLKRASKAPGQKSGSKPHL